MRRKIIQACSFAVLLVLAGCVSIGPSNVDITDVAINRSLAVSRVNAYRASHGLPPLIHDSRLDQVSRDMAHLITRNDSMGTWQHSARGLSGRLNGAGYRTFAGAENLGAGYVSFDHAFSGWKGSPGHNKNLLNKYVTRIGMAWSKRPDGKWRNFWVMTLARPIADGPPNL
ncbi:MAG: CAP domain-containing protein [Rhizobiaceae bacterium]|nr:CAP domain-containing protein [Rhizobiaceae bacterium]|tara:strand:- start:19478 stop:19990 length:513 start_codon:yes stop_codon:yes gene_type:complete